MQQRHHSISHLRSTSGVYLPLAKLSFLLRPRAFSTSLSSHIKSDYNQLRLEGKSGWI